MAINVLGLDPGPIPGLITLHWPGASRSWADVTVHAYQCDAASAPGLLALLLKAQRGGWAAGGIERYVQGNLKPEAAHGGLTARQEHELRQVALGYGLTLGCLPAGTVKPWATKRRMDKSGVWDQVPAKLIHARSAAQVAVYWAVYSGKVPDPLSNKAILG